MAITKAKLIADGVITVDNLHESHGITTTHIGEGNKLFYTDTRVSNYLSANNYITTGDVPNLETVTSLSISANILSYTNEAGITTNIDLSTYLDDTNLARLVSGTLNPGTGIATFTRDDSSTFTIDFSAFLADANDYVSSGSFNTSTGVLTLTRLGGGTVTVDLDGKYAEASHTHLWSHITDRPTALSAFTNDLGNYGGFLTSFTETDPIYTASSWYTTTNNASNWNTAYGWGNHANAGYLTSATKLVSPNSGNVVTADSALPDAGHSFIHTLALGPGGNDGHILGMTWANTTSSYGAQIFVDTDPTNTMAFRSRSAAGVWTGWNTVVHSGNIGSQSVNYATSAGTATDPTKLPLTGGTLNVNASSTITLTSAGTNASYIKAGAGDELYIGGNDSWQMRFNGANVLMDNGGYLQNDSSLRAPIFYDSNDTGHYLNPQGFSNLGRIKFNDVVSSGAPVGDAVVGRNYAYNTLELKGYGAEMMIGAQSTDIHINYRYCNNTGNNSYTPQNWYWRNGTSSGLSEHYWGIGYGVYSLRAPILYDYNDTGYYVDPNNVSNLYGVAIRGDADATGVGNQIFFWGGGYTTTSAIGFKYSGGYFPNPTGSGDGYNTFLTMDTPGRGWVFRQGVGGNDFGAAYTSGWILNNGVWQANASMRAPIFYDSNNTAHYIDPSGGSNIRNLYVGDTGSSWSDPGGWGTQFHVSNGPHSIIRVYARNEGIQTGMYSHVGGLSKAGSLSNHDFRIIRNDSDRMIFYSGSTYSYGYLEAQNSLRATIFYDSNDTNFYVDPTGTSRLNSIDTNDGNIELYKGQTIDLSGAEYSTSNYYPVMISVPTSGAWIQIQNNLNANAPSWATHGSGFTLNLRWWTNGNGWGTTEVNRRVTQYHERFTNSRICGGITQMGTSSQEVVYLRGGGVYYFKYSRNISGFASSTNYTNPYGVESANVTSSPINDVWNSRSGYQQVWADAIRATSDLHTPIIYDYNDTGYYLDPNSSGTCFRGAGSVNVNGDVTAYYSDMRLKTKIADIKNPIEKVKSLSGFIYEPNEIAQSYGYKKEQKVGVSAQEVQAVLPEAVKDAPIGNGYLTVQYDKLVPLLIEAIKEQQKEIEELKAIVNGITK